MNNPNLDQIRPLGIAVSVLLVLGGPTFFAESIRNVARVFDADSAELLKTTGHIQDDLLRIKWKRSAPVVFCNKYSLTYEAY